MRRHAPAPIVRDRRGSVSLLAAAALSIATGGLALAVDMGALYQESRKLQGMADAAALAAAGNLSSVGDAAQGVIAANAPRQSVASIIVTGTWRADPAVAPASRFVAGGGSPNAARVTLSEDAPLYFGRVFGLRSVHMSRRATAARVDQAAFSLGSRLLALDGGIANQLLSALAGSTVSLSVADYNALAGADIDLLSFARALQSELRLTGVSYTQTLATTTTLPHILNALAATLAADGSAGAAAAITRLGAGVGATPITATQLIDLGQIGAQDHAAAGQSVMVDAYGFTQALLQIAGGARQVALALGSTIPGLTGTNVTLAIGDRMVSSPWVTVTASGDPVIRTAQIRLYIDTMIGGSAALQALGVTAVRLPLYVELAQAQAKLSSLACGGGARAVTLSVLPSIGHAAIADVSTAGLADMSATPVERPATFVNILGLKATGSAILPLSGNGWQSVPFAAGDIDARAIKTVTSGGTASALATALDGKLSVSVAVGPLSLPSASIGALIKPVLDTAAPLVDQLLAGLLDLLGVHPGQADVRIDALRCGAAALVA